MQTLRADAERVFREHNRVSAELMLVLPELDPATPTAQALVEADVAMLEACEPLNEMAVARRDEMRIGVGARLRIPAAIRRCEAATATAAELVAAR